MRQRKKLHPSAERELSLAAEDEVKQLLGFVLVECYGGGECVVRCDCEDEDDRELVLVRSLWSLGEVAKQVTGDDDA